MVQYLSIESTVEETYIIYIIEDNGKMDKSMVKEKCSFSSMPIKVGFGISMAISNLVLITNMTWKAISKSHLVQAIELKDFLAK